MSAIELPGNDRTLTFICRDNFFSSRLLMMESAAIRSVLAGHLWVS